MPGKKTLSEGPRRWWRYWSISPMRKSREHWDNVYNPSAGQVVAVQHTWGLCHHADPWLQAPLQPGDSSQTMGNQGTLCCGKRTSAWEKTAKNIYADMYFSPLYSRIFAKVCLALFPTDSSECPTAAGKVFLCKPVFTYKSCWLGLPLPNLL